MWVISKVRGEFPAKTFFNQKKTGALEKKERKKSTPADVADFTKEEIRSKNKRNAWQAQRTTKPRCGIGKTMNAAKTIAGQGSVLYQWTKRWESNIKPSAQRRPQMGPRDRDEKKEESRNTPGKERRLRGATSGFGARREKLPASGRFGEARL